MKVIFFSDIHGNQFAFDAFIEKLVIEKPDLIIFCGDVVGYYYGADEIISKMRKLNMICLLGNHDQFLIDLANGKNNEVDLIYKYGNSYRNILNHVKLEHIEYLKTLLPYKFLDLCGKKVAVFHGSPDDPLNGRVYPDAIIEENYKYNQWDLVVLGHTHHKMIKYIGNTIILNPGSLGQQRDGKGCSYLVLEITEQIEFEFKTIEYDIELLLNEVNQKDYGRAQLIEVLTRKG